MIGSEAARPNADVWQRIGDWLARHQRQIRWTQWLVVAAYVILLVVPAVLPLPGNTATIWTNFTRFAQFVFWGLWWPLVLLSTVLVGRFWCGILCPEGAISEFSSRYGCGRAIPRWVQWVGWPTAAFAFTTLYGQMTSVYQYPKPAFLVLGGSTLAAAAIGYLYGKNKRVWCRYLCPVSGVFGLLSKLAFVHFQVDQTRWFHSQQSGIKPGYVNCAPLVALRTMSGSSSCHMCGRCSGFRGAICLARRSPNYEIVHVAGKHPKPWETGLIIFGLMGVAVGAFHWAASPLYVAAKQMAAWSLIDAGVLWPMEASAPWWLLTNYPDQNDVLTLLDGFILIGYVFATALVAGLLISVLLAFATRCLGSWDWARFHHLAQTLIPIAAAGVILGLSALTVSQLRIDGINLPFVAEGRVVFLSASTLWSCYLCWQVTGLYTGNAIARLLAMAGTSLSLLFVNSGWFLFFWVW